MRWLHALRGLWFYLRYYSVFDRGSLKGKRIAVVGPADSTNDRGLGPFIDSFDVVIRINKAPFQIRDGVRPRDIGTKTDILFHSFFENDFSGGGSLDFRLFDQLGIQQVINPIPTFFGKRTTFNFYKKYRLARRIYTLPRAWFDDLTARAFGPFRPTTGFCALMTALESPFATLFIAGFTFFKTPYADGYRDSLKDVETNRKYIQDSNQHSPELEYQQFIRLLRKHLSKSILVDEALGQLLTREGVEVVIHRAM